ncbi:MAG TPA: hypothetical protein VMV69_14695 [Pirellulales bacterium]|nr:hypothetical protein [Pirellulales bacterium]
MTPAAWERLVEAATCQARSGDPRAREWIASVLGADSAIDEFGRADAVAGYSTISSMTRTLQRERAERERRGHEDLSRAEHRRCAKKNDSETPPKEIQKTVG